MKTITNKSLKRKWILRFFVFLLICFTPLSLRATELSEWQVRNAVETWLRNVITDYKPDAVVEEMESYIAEGKIVAYIAHLAGDGFCLCGRDDRLLPVYLYSPHGTYDSDNPNHQYVLWEIATRTKMIAEMEEEYNPILLQDQPVMLQRASYWQELIAGNTPVRVSEYEADAEPSSMVLNLTSVWHQFGPYNDFCPAPSGLPNDHCIVGCVGTAMAQIMNYWKWPHVGNGSHSVYYNYRYRTNWDAEPCPTDPQIPANWPDWDDEDRLQWTSTAGGTLWMTGYWDWSVLAAAQNDAAILNKTSEYLAALDALYNRLTPVAQLNTASFGTTTYDWSVLKDDHDDPPNAVGDFEVAVLNKHVAISINTSFGLWGSSSSGPEIEQAVKNYFFYDTDARTDPTNIYTMTDEIQWLRPVALGGQAIGGGGHMWVVLGYDKATDPDRLFLMNMGWRNREVDWYTWDHYFPVGQEHVTQIAPTKVRFVGDTSLGDGTPDNPYYNIEEAVIEAPNGTTLIFKAGSVNTFSAGTMVINKPLILKGYNAVIQ
ncbi:C10 family peptidase [Planctomycetota bacterium]